MTIDEIRKLCREVVDKYDKQKSSEMHETRKEDEVQVYLTLKFKVSLKPEKKLLDKT